MSKHGRRNRHREPLSEWDEIELLAVDLPPRRKHRSRQLRRENLDEPMRGRGRRWRGPAPEEMEDWRDWRLR